MPLIYISIGSNNRRDYHIRCAVHALKRQFGQVQLSSVYESDAVGFVGEPFYNLVAAAHTELSIADCIAVFKQIEDDFGRDRSAAKFSGRTLDLDLLTYDEVICQKPVELPRAEITENAFVLWPMAELAANTQHPLTRLSYSELWQAYPKTKQKIWPVPFTWSE